MSWKNLKILAIAILFVVDVFFFFSIAERNHATRYYPDSLIESANAVFRESNLYVDRSILSARIVTMPAYEGNASYDELPFVATMRDAVYTRRQETSGVRFIGEDGEFFFGNDFSFFYFDPTSSDRPSILLEGEDYVLSEQSVRTDAVKNTVEAFLAEWSLLPNGGRYTYAFETDTFYVSEDHYIVHMTQSIGGYEIGDGLYFLVAQGRVLAADGVFVPFGVETRMRADTVGIMDVFLSEKKYLDDSYRASGEVSRKNMVLAGVSYAYQPYFDTNGELYLVPVCTVRYTDGETRRYNFVSGKMLP